MFYTPFTVNFHFAQQLLSPHNNGYHQHSWIQHDFIDSFIELSTENREKGHFLKHLPNASSLFVLLLVKLMLLGQNRVLSTFFLSYLFRFARSQWNSNVEAVDYFHQDFHTFTHSQTVRSDQQQPTVCLTTIPIHWPLLYTRPFLHSPASLWQTHETCAFI